MRSKKKVVAKRRSWKAEAERLQAEVARLEKQLADAGEQHIVDVEEAGSQLAAKNAELNEANTQIETLTGQVATLTEELAATNKEIQRVAADRHRVTLSLAKTDEKLRAARAEIALRRRVAGALATFLLSGRSLEEASRMFVELSMRMGFDPESSEEVVSEAFKIAGRAIHRNIFGDLTIPGAIPLAERGKRDFGETGVLINLRLKDLDHLAALFGLESPESK